MRSQKQGQLRPRVPSDSCAWATTLPETVLVHTDDGPSGVVEVEIRVQPAVFIFALAPATTVAVERALVNW